MENTIQQIESMLAINKNQKEQLLKLVEMHPKWDPILRHNIIHHCMIIESMPEKLENESDFDYRTRLLQCKRRLDEQNRLAECLLIVFRGN